jgi:ferredoxin--NADP+ reductase
VPKGQIGARLTSRQDLSRDLSIFVFEPEVEVDFLPGQYVALGVQEGGRLIQRDYSIASSPHQKFLEFFIESVDGGHLTPRLFHLHPGALISVKPPKGTFTLDRTSGRPHHLMVATVTGIAPFVSMVRTLAIDERLGQPPGIQIALLQGASRAYELGYNEELGRLATAHPWLVYIPTVSRPMENPGWRGETGRVETLIAKTLDTLHWTPLDTTAYLCGHPGMIERGTKILMVRGFQRAQIREEQYWMEKQ